MGRPEAVAGSTPATSTSTSTKQPRSPLTRKQVETVLSRSVAWFSIVFALQAVPLLLVQYELEEPVWSAIVVPAISGSLLVALICSTIKRWVIGSHLVVAFVYLVALLSWPFFLADPAVTQVGNHWLYQLLTVGTATAAIGLSVRGALIYLVAVPLMYGIIRTSPAGGAAPWELGLFDSVYAIILGGAVLMIMTMIRVAATSVDDAQGAALDRYARAVHQHATEVERVRVDSIVHDSVLTTLLTAARAESPEQKALLAHMASNAMKHLREAALALPENASTVRLRQLADRMVTVSREMPAPFDVRVRSLDTRVMPAAQAEALSAAAVQAMWNSVQHAGGPEVRRWLKVSGVRGSVIRIEVGDAGSGFDLDQVPDARLGVRRSIIERTASAGGRATIVSSPGAGTVVTLSWPVFSPAVIPGVSGVS